MSWKIFLLCSFGVSVCSAKEGSRIIGGDLAFEGQFPYQVYLQSNLGICGGSIIGDQYILTAAHCIVNMDGSFKNTRFLIIMGTVDLKNPSKSTIKIPLERVYVPKVFRPQDRVPGKPFETPGDIAVIKLEDPIGLDRNDKVEKLKLPKVPHPETIGATAIITGFGLISIRITTDPITGEQNVDGDLGYKLRYAETKIVSYDECQGKFSHPVLEEQICSKVEQRYTHQSEGVCMGDSGGPLVLNGDTVIGVLHGSPSNCNEFNTPSIYTRTASYLSFIENAMNDKRDESTMRLAIWQQPNARSPSILMEIP